jgi:hypothetical protein
MLNPPNFGGMGVPNAASGSLPGQIPGTATNDNAAAGNIGEYISASVAAGSAVPLTNNVPANVTSMSLTAGDWDVWGNITFAPAGGTVTTGLFGSINTTSAAFPVLPGTGAYVGLTVSQTGGGGTLPVGQTRVSLAATTTVFLVAQSGFSAGTSSAYGFIGARRRR